MQKARTAYSGIQRLLSLVLQAGPSHRPMAAKKGDRSLTLASDWRGMHAPINKRGREGWGTHGRRRGWTAAAFGCTPSGPVLAAPPPPLLLPPCQARDQARMRTAPAERYTVHSATRATFSERTITNHLRNSGAGESNRIIPAAGCLSTDESIRSSNRHWPARLLERQCTLRS